MSINLIDYFLSPVRSRSLKSAEYAETFPSFTRIGCFFFSHGYMKI
jgi:hypothetical protein